MMALQDQFRQDLWQYQFHSLEPNEEGRISTENFLCTNLVNLKGHQVEKFRRQIKKVCAEFDKNDPGVTQNEFLAWQYFFEDIDVIKRELAKLKFLDYSSYLDVVEKFFIHHPYCVSNKVQINERLAKVVFNFMDTDESGELEPEEVHIFNRNMMGQSQEAQAKQEFEVWFNKKKAAALGWISEVTGFI